MRRAHSELMLPTLPIETALLKPGLRLAVGVSGGADSVALLRTLAARSSELGLVLHVAHLHHGLRGAEADADRDFAVRLGEGLGLPVHEARVDTGREAAENGESIEEAARRLRYDWFRQLMASGEVDAVATAHTRDDQAETVLGKFLRGAWTEGLSGIHPVVNFPEGRILRPLLGATRAQVVAFLTAAGQPWREDSSNRDPAFTRNRLRHELLPVLETWNPRLADHLAQMAALARDEEAWWQAELARLAPQLILPGRPVRGGGRASGPISSNHALAIDVIQLRTLAPALQRRLLRHAAGQLGVSLDFLATESLRTLALSGKSGQRHELAGNLRAERTPRELRLTSQPASAAQADAEPLPEYTVPVPGEVAAPAFGVCLQIEISPPGGVQGSMQKTATAPIEVDENDPLTAEEPQASAALDPASGGHSQASATGGRTAKLRNWQPGDRIRQRYSAAPRKVKEVLERLRITGSARAVWPVLELDGRIVWMKGVELEPEKGFVVSTTMVGEPRTDEDERPDFGL